MAPKVGLAIRHTLIAQLEHPPPPTPCPLHCQPRDNLPGIPHNRILRRLHIQQPPYPPQFLNRGEGEGGPVRREEGVQGGGGFGGGVVHLIAGVKG